MGSETPSSFTRLRSVVMLEVMAKSRRSRTCCGGHHAIDRGAAGDVGIAAVEIGLRLLECGAHRGEIGARGQQHAQAIGNVRIDRAAW